MKKMEPRRAFNVHFMPDGLVVDAVITKAADADRLIEILKANRALFDPAGEHEYVDCPAGGCEKCIGWDPPDNSTAPI